MQNKKLYIIAFIVLAIIQLIVPAKMLWHNNDILTNGKIYKFKNQPIDPYDAFRGKYIFLNYELSSIYLKKQIKNTSEVYAVLGTDNQGFAKITYLTPYKPKTGDFVKVTLTSSSEYDNKIQAWINFPFDRYYMNEYKAPIAEKNYTEATRNKTETVYALVAVKNGEGIVKDVIIDDIPIKSYIKKAVSN